MSKINPLLAIDFYKASHKFQYPNNTNFIYSNFTPRSFKRYKGKSDKLVWVGLQVFIKDYLISEWNEGFFDQPKEKVVGQYKTFMDSTLGPDVIPVDHIAALHDLGFLPIKIKSLPEGTLVPAKVPVLTICNTIPEFYWLVNYLETVMSAELWKISTNATIAYEYRKVFDKYAEITGADKGFVLFQGHDFSARGLSNREDQYKTQISHLFSFAGTDTCLAIQGAADFYNADYTKELVGTSVPATEHSVMAMGEKESELETYRRLITELYPSGIVSIVSDTWDFWKVISEYTVELKDEILNRQENALGLAKVVFRPDSGNPVDIICGENSPFQKRVTPQEKGAIEVLWDIFGGTINEKGYKVLNPRVGLIYGDSITLERQEEILKRLQAKGFCSSNIVLGIGSYTYQYNTRDTFGFAMKATYGEVDGVGREIFKDPITDDGTKKSARGLLAVEHSKIDGTLVLRDQCTKYEEERGLLRSVFENGNLLIDEDFSTIKERLHP